MIVFALNFFARIFLNLKTIQIFQRYSKFYAHTMRTKELYNEWMETICAYEK